MPRTTIEQWQILETIVSAGGFAQAAAQLNRSQSAISYAVAQLQQRLGLTLLRLEGRKAKLTEVGHALLEDARPLIADLELLEERARVLQGGDEARIRLRVDSIFPKLHLFSALGTFRRAHRHTRVDVAEVARQTVHDAFSPEQAADLCIAALAPGEALGRPLIDIPFIAVARADHPLLHSGKKVLNAHDLSRHLTVTIQDPHAPSPEPPANRRVGERWTVNTVEAAVSAIASGLCFGWLPRPLAADYLSCDAWRSLPLENGGERIVSLSLVYADYDRAGPAVRALADALRESCLSTAG